MEYLIAQCDSFFGCVSPPPGVVTYGADITGMMGLANNILKLIIVFAGIYAFLNIIIAGYTFLGAGGDAKKVQQAWEKIWQSMLGLLFVAGSLVLAAILGWLIFKDPTAIINPKIYGP
jgi:hypothetical protein